jgi:predicted Zn finger-like uncharacterized protein
MIIECANCNKKFNVDDNLIPEKGRQIQCGSCNHSWYYISESLIHENIDNHQKIELSDKHNLEDEDYEKLADNKLSKSIKKEKKTQDFKVKINANADDEIESKSISNFFSYLIIFLITFIALIILIDTLKSPLINIFPGLEIILFNLFESFKDIKLFIIDLT